MSDTQLKALLAFAFLVWGISLAASGQQVSPAFFRPFSTVAGVVAVGLGLFDRWLWHWRIWRGWLVKRPDLRGTWRVELRPEPDGQRRAAGGQTLEAYMVIRQTFSSLTMRLATEESSSESVGGEIRRSEDGLYRVAGVYRNEPRLGIRDRSAIHHGALLLDVRGEPAESLDGHYWTDRLSRGEIRLTQRTVEAFDTFEAARAAMGMPKSP